MALTTTQSPFDMVSPSRLPPAFEEAQHWTDVRSILLACAALCCIFFAVMALLVLLN